jgi:rhodanese-related sulfurtransferase
VRNYPLPIRNITPKELKSWLDANEDVVVVDVRLPEELEISRLNFSQHVVLHELPDRLDEIPKDKNVILVCRSGGRSMQAAFFLANEGWDADRLFNLDGGILAWAREIDPSLPTFY